MSGQPQPWQEQPQGWQQGSWQQQSQSQQQPQSQQHFGAPEPRPGQGLVNPQDARAALEARRELGPDMEQALVDSFVARVEDALVRRRSDDSSDLRARSEAAKVDSRNQMVLGIVSLGVAIPLTAIAGGLGGLTAMVFVWVTIVAVNMAYAMRKGRREE